MKNYTFDPSNLIVEACINYFEKIDLQKFF